MSGNVNALWFDKITSPFDLRDFLVRIDPQMWLSIARPKSNRPVKPGKVIVMIVNRRDEPADAKLALDFILEDLRFSRRAIGRSIKRLTIRLEADGKQNRVG